MTGQRDWLDSLEKIWRQRGLVACLLWPFSLLYGLVSVLHRGLYQLGVFKIERCNVPVIVVGNVVAGGAGKTPLVIALAKHLQQQGLQVGVVSRGYGRQGKNCLEVLGNTPILMSGDEPALILYARAAPVFVANKRMDAVRALLEKYPATQVIISDDGLQHHAMGRNMEIVVFDDRGIGNGWLLPAGPLRQHYKPGQSGAALVLHTGQNPAFGGFVSTRRLADFGVTADGSQVLLAGLKNQPLSALAGIANPSTFFDMLTARGLQLNLTTSLPDHFDFSSYELPAGGSATVLCTEKDAIKLFKMPRNEKISLLAVPLEFAPEPAFLKAVDDLLTPLISKPVV